ncbi:DUF2214 family protein [Nitratireductor sp. ZSWI3]|uniref:DUF2214 family protein n=1 Tax=Nitratireductor sp. ZSWI3 TaxID=2966359 RepID=UPI0021506B29|nr:DUF2214 family protein [Nitratireductor sp. ZSWI3]MCR4267339.1 DUF2214 family protein [Nitratireductor sp. ZSWI3]
MSDLILAILHHLLVFLLAAVLAGEFVLLRPGISGRDLKLLAHIDRAYGGIALAVILVGIGRVLHGLKGWEFYVYNWAFWAKMAAFATVGLLSIAPTTRIRGWARTAGKDAAYAVPDAEVSAARRYLRLEVLVFALIPVFAAMMARGVGY